MVSVLVASVTAQTPTPTLTTSGCSHLNNCNGHGNCIERNGRGVCECYEGWGAADDIAIYRSPDCSQRTCPSAYEWVAVATAPTVAREIVECAGQGTCDRVTGTCVCYPTFTGNACQRTRCFNDCSGHGKCLSMARLAKEPNAIPLTVDQNNTYGGFETSTTWDADRIFGCVCDSSWPVGFAAGQFQEGEWYGPDCSRRRCPNGDDPHTTVDETDCEGKKNNGADDGPGEAGNKCYVACSNRGLCNFNTGLCACFDGWHGERCEIQQALAKQRIDRVL